MQPDKRRLLKGLAAGLAGSAFRLAASPAQAAGAPFRLDAASHKTTLPGDQAARDVLGYDATPGGPLIRLAKGTELSVALHNGLGETTSLQWHGLVCPNAVDRPPRIGDPGLRPGATTAIRFVPRDSGLSWFHPAYEPGRPDATALGLRGVLLVEEAEPPQVDRDLLVTVADWGSGPDPHGVTTVNGKALPERATIVSGGRLRLRVVNASTWRIMLLAIDGARPMIVAIDGQPSDLFEPVHDTVPVGPGARFEFMIDGPATPGAQVRLVMRGTERVAGVLEANRTLAEVTTTGSARPTLPPIEALPRNPFLPAAIPLEQSVRADLAIEAVEPRPAPGVARWSLNGLAALALPERPLLTVRRGGTVTLGLANRSAEPVALRVHGQVMRLLHAKDDGWEPYWRDSVLLPPKSVSHVAFVADNPGLWLIESAIFTQASGGLRTVFEVQG